MRILYAVLIFYVAAVPSWAGRPLATEDAYTVGRRSLELEFGLEYADAPKECRQYGHGLVVTYGVADVFDAALEVPVVLSRVEGGEKAFGFGDVAALAKFKLAEVRLLTLAVVPEIKFATGDEVRGLGSGSNDIAALAAASLALGAATLHGNVGYSHAFPNSREAKGCAFAAVAAEVFARERLGVAAEVLADFARDEETGKYAMSAAGGFSYAVANALVLDAGVSFGFGAAEGEFGATVGATWAVF